MRNFERLISLGWRLVSAICLLFVLAVTTSAYSIVMRSGKRIEIPDKFNVTNLTLTYETAPGFWVTLQMSVIDIPATEKANNEKPGSLLARAAQEREAQEQATVTSQTTTQTKASRTVTNRDLESFERQRVASERAYDQKLNDMGLPPLAELRAQGAAESERLWQELAQRRAEAEAKERDAQLQAQLAALNAQLNLIQIRLNEGSGIWPDGFPILGGIPFFDSFGHSRFNRVRFNVPTGFPIGGGFASFNLPSVFPSPFRGRRNIFVAPGTRIRGRIHFGGHRRGGGRRSH
jgi:hypothetical protein